MNISNQQLQRLAFELRKRYPRITAGLHEGVKAGNGLTPLPARPYEPGDAFNRVAWAETARFGELMTRDFQVSHDLRTLLVVDYPARSVWGGGDALVLKSELAGYCAEALTQLLIWQGDRTGHIVAGTKLYKSPMSGGHVSLQNLRRQLSKAEPGKTDSLHAAVRSPLRESHRRELVVVISDFLGESGWETPLGALARRHDVVAVQIRDRWDLELPNLGSLVLTDGATTRRVKASSAKIRRKYHQEATALDEHIASTMRRARIRHIQLDTSRSLIEQLVRAFTRTQQTRRTA